MWVVRGCNGWRAYVWDASQQFLRQSKNRQLGLEQNSFSDGRQTDTEDSSRLGLEPNSFSVVRQIDAWDLSWTGLDPNSFAVGRRTDVWDSSRLGLESIDSSRLGLESINSFGHILCKEVPCITVLGTRELTISIMSLIFCASPSNTIWCIFKIFFLYIILVQCTVITLVMNSKHWYINAFWRWLIMFLLNMFFLGYQGLSSWSVHPMHFQGKWIIVHLPCPNFVSNLKWQL